MTVKITPNPLVACLLFDGMGALELGVTIEVFGLPRPEMEPGWYRFVTFSEDRGATTLVMRQRFASAAERAAKVDCGAFKGWGQSFDSLEELLLKQQDHQP